MESSPELFALEFTPSVEELYPQSARFNIADLLNLNIPSPEQSDSSGCETPTSSPSYLTSRPSTPTTPLSSPSALGSVFRTLNFPVHKIRMDNFPLSKLLAGRNMSKKGRLDSKKGSHNRRIHR